MGLLREGKEFAASMLGSLLLAVRRDSASPGTGVSDGDVGALSMDADGNLRVAGTTTSGGGSVAHDAVATGVAPTLVGGYASAAAPTSVSADGDAVRAWLLRNGAVAINITAAGALIPGDATNGLYVNLRNIALPAVMVTAQNTDVDTAAEQLTAASVPVTTTPVVTAAPDNPDGSIVYVGPSGVTTSTGYPLAPGQSVPVPVANLNAIYVIGSENNLKAAAIAGG